jgi:tungstate transport system substrate-binding protein
VIRSPRGLLAAIVAGIVIVSFSTGCSPSGSGGRLILATTSSADDVGLLDELVAAWSREHAAPTVQVLVVGSGEALALGGRGDADVLLVHAPDAEAEFMAAGRGVVHWPVMRNTFLIVGPASDPASVSDAMTVAEVLHRIDREARFLSRGDGSGTHQRELQLRRAAGLGGGAGSGAGGYLDAGQGMAETLRMADQLSAYTLTDDATWQVWRERLSLVAFPLRDSLLYNSYSVIVPAAARDTAAGLRFARWLTGESAQSLIAAFIGPAGTPLFEPATESRR